MYFGEAGELISETSAFPGSVGDSCANSARMMHLRVLLGETITEAEKQMLVKFRTVHGYTRHWTAPTSWQESDFTSDQALPLFIAFQACGLGYYASEMAARIKHAKYKTGNGDLVSPVLWALLYDHKFAARVFVRGQELLFKLPYRWNDEQHGLEKMELSSADFLNYFHVVKHLDLSFGVEKSIVLDKIASYFHNEPDSAWLIEMYRRAIDA